ncbi:MAG: signal peptidase II [Clostridiales bacterium]|nr:signal peptidase II [Clostridiales bacterium]
MADEKKSTFKDKLSAFWGVVKRYAKRVWAYLKVAKMEYIVMISLFALDLISKAIINATIDVGETVVVIPYVLQFTNLHNSNAAFGSSWMTSWLGPLGSRIFFCVFAVAVSVIFILILIRHKGGSKLFRVSLAMLVAGAMGNCIDRWALAYVRDFVEFVYFGLTIGGRKSFYVFNIADAELVIGVILIIIYFIFVYKDKSSEKKQSLLLGSEDEDEEGGVAVDVSIESDSPAVSADTTDGEASEQATAEAIESDSALDGETPEETIEEAPESEMLATDTQETDTQYGGGGGA